MKSIIDSLLQQSVLIFYFFVCNTPTLPVKREVKLDSDRNQKDNGGDWLWEWWGQGKGEQWGKRGTTVTEQQ